MQFLFCRLNATKPTRYNCDVPAAWFADGDRDISANGRVASHSGHSDNSSSLCCMLRRRLQPVIITNTTALYFAGRGEVSKSATRKRLASHGSVLQQRIMKQTRIFINCCDFRLSFRRSFRIFECCYCLSTPLVRRSLLREALQSMMA